MLIIVTPDAHVVVWPSLGNKTDQTGRARENNLAETRETKDETAPSIWVLSGFFLGSADNTRPRPAHTHHARARTRARATCTLHLCLYLSLSLQK